MWLLPMSLIALFAAAALGNGSDVSWRHGVQDHLKNVQVNSLNPKPYTTRKTFYYSSQAEVLHREAQAPISRRTLTLWSACGFAVVLLYRCKNGFKA